MRKNITVVIPIYNENAESVIKKSIYFANIQSVDKILLVDDFSIVPVQHIDNNKVYVFRTPYNMGKANAVAYVRNKIDTDFVFLQDADDEYPIENIESLYNKAIEYNFDMIVTKRFVPIDKITFSGVIANKLIYKILGLPDAFSGQRIIKTEKFLQCKISGGFELETQLNMCAIQNNWKIGYLDSLYYPRTYKDGKKIKYYHYWIP